MTVAQKPLFHTLCHTCNGSTRVAENPADPGDGWTVPCPACGDPEDGREYDPERATIPY